MPAPPTTPDEFIAHFRDNYNTPLDPEQEAAFQGWAAAQNRLNDLNDYDMRGAWLEGAKQGGNGHFTSRYKKPNHPTFSDESVYHGTESPWGWYFEGGTWGEGGKSYRPSQRMFVRTHDRKALEEYMGKNEPNATLIWPE